MRDSLTILPYLELHSLASTVPESLLAVKGLVDVELIGLINSHLHIVYFN